MKQSPIVLIGCGRIGFLLEDDPLRNKPCTHFGGASSAGIRITHACDINPARLDRFVSVAGIPEQNTSKDYRALLETVRPRMAIIATWTESHYEIATHAARCGARIIVLEKPVTSDLKKAMSLMDTAAKHGAAIIINHERRYDSRYRKTREMIREGKIGRVKTVHASILTGGGSSSAGPEQGGDRSFMTGPTWWT